MASFFFHIALDLEQLSSPTADTSSERANPLRTPFRSIIKETRSPPDRRYIQNAPVTLSCPSSEEATTDTKSGPPSLSGRGNISPHTNGGSGNTTDGSTPRLADDWRYNRIYIDSISMARWTMAENHDDNKGMDTRIASGIAVEPGGLITKGRFEPCEPNQHDLGLGVVRLYRDALGTPGLYDDVSSAKGAKNVRKSLTHPEKEVPPIRDEDCTTLCILAVPSYLTPSEFLAFVGDKTRDEVSHIRMIRTERINRYMVLMKFKSGKKAREWRKEWNGKAFDELETEYCHVVFVKSIELRLRQEDGSEPSFPDMTNDPFTPLPPRAEKSISANAVSQSSLLSATFRSTKPIAPPTPALIEMPTCPVCLERMDESTGLLTVLCQHVFHCSCLQKWKGSGCPVCRYTQDDSGKKSRGTGEELGLKGCRICSSDSNLWICLICGNVGCGRYDAAHAFLHYQHSSHCFAMDLATQRVWDYAGDGYVHRIMQNKLDGQLVKLPSTITPPADHAVSDFDDYVPREKLDNMSFEYTHLLASQLDSQRMYFEESLERAADKSSKATRAAEKAIEASSLLTEQVTSLQLAYDSLLRDAIPALERDCERAGRKADKFEAMARKLEKEWRDEKAMSGSLLEKVQLLTEENERLKAERSELEEQNRDLGFFISGGERLREGLQGAAEGGVTKEDVREGTVSLPEATTPPGRGKKKKGIKGRKL